MFAGSSSGVLGSIVRQWDGLNWTTPGPGIVQAGRGVTGMCYGTLGGSEMLFVTGSFTVHQYSTAVADWIQAWDGSTWLALGDGLIPAADAWTRALIIHDDGSGPRLFVGGQMQRFDFDPQQPNTFTPVMAWDGAAWDEVDLDGDGDFGIANCFTEYDDGNGTDLFAGGQFVVDDPPLPPTYGVARWDGSGWTCFGVTDGEVLALAAYKGSLYVGGISSEIGGISTRGIARWDGTNWYSVGGGTEGVPGPEDDWDYPGIVNSLCTYRDETSSSLYAGGEFKLMGGAIPNLARWDGNSWYSVGSGPGYGVHSMTLHDAGPGSAARLAVGGGNAVDLWGGCACLADVAMDGTVDFFDLQTFLAWFSASNPCADWNQDESLDFFDVQAYLNDYSDCGGE